MDNIPMVGLLVLKKVEQGHGYYHVIRVLGCCEGNTNGNYF